MLLCSSQRWTLLHRHTSSSGTRTSELWSDLVSKWQCPKPFTTTQFKSSVQSWFVPFFSFFPPNKEFIWLWKNYLHIMASFRNLQHILWTVMFSYEWCRCAEFQFKVHLSQEPGEPSRSAWPIHSTFLFLVPLLVIPCCSTFATSTHVCQIIN